MNSRRVVVTGMGIWSCLGQDLSTVAENLRSGRSGIVFDPSRLEYGLQSGLVGNVPRPDLRRLLPRKLRVTMSPDAEYAYMAALQAFAQAGIDADYREAHEVGCIFGSDGAMTSIAELTTLMREEHCSLMAGPNMLFRCLSSSSAINLATAFSLRGAVLNIGATCSTSSHAIGVAMMYIRQGLQDVCLVGGSAETAAETAAGVDALYALSLRNDDPQRASRPFDCDRDGMVPSGGAAALVLEDYDHAVARGADILAEVCGYGFSSNGTDDISTPSADAEYLAMQRALSDAGISAAEVDYVNAHGTSTQVGDIAEAEALTRLFSSNTDFSSCKAPLISSTKSMTGHELWMAGASEAVYSILMMHGGFVAPNLNLDNVIPQAQQLSLVRRTIKTSVNVVLSNSSGMGGTNSAIVLRRITH